jgi:hypothetical protein
MEPEGSLTYSQAPATRPYPEPTPSSPHDPLQLPEEHLIITIQKVTSNVPSVPRQSPDIYWHADLCSRRPCSA